MIRTWDAGNAIPYLIYSRYRNKQTRSTVQKVKGAPPIEINISIMSQKTTLLLDLDDTLLDTNIQAFIPAYFSALATALAGQVSPDSMLPALTGGTKAMMQNQDPGRTLRDVFDAYFFPKLGVDRNELGELISKFYDEIFPSLSHVASQRPEAIQFVNWAFEQGHRVAVATNPYFPLKAVQHRMRWAGLPPEEYDFSLVSSYETFHFTKEFPAYFLEFLGQLGWPEGPVVMVGNDLEMDLVPAQKAGLAIFWIREGRDADHPEIPQGNFNDLREWLEKTEPDQLLPAINTPEAVLSLILSSPAALETMTEKASAEMWRKHPAEGEWNLTEIFCHMRDVEQDVNLPRLQKIAEEQNPFLPGVNSDEWVVKRNYAEQDGQAALKIFCEKRIETHALLEGLRRPWDQPVRHAIFGPTSLHELAGIIAGHDQAHIRQAWKTMRA